MESNISGDDTESLRKKHRDLDQEIDRANRNHLRLDPSTLQMKKRQRLAIKAELSRRARAGDMVAYAYARNRRWTVPESIPEKQVA